MNGFLKKISDLFKGGDNQDTCQQVQQKQYAFISPHGQNKLTFLNHLVPHMQQLTDQIGSNFIQTELDGVKLYIWDCDYPTSVELGFLNGYIFYYEYQHGSNALEAIKSYCQLVNKRKIPIYVVVDVQSIQNGLHHMNLDDLWHIDLSAYFVNSNDRNNVLHVISKILQH